MDSATESIWNESSARLRGLIARRIRDEHAAQDLLQETFARIHAGLADLKNYERLGPWMTRIAKNVVHDYLRSSDRASSLVDEVPSKSEEENWNLNAEVGRSLQRLIEILPPTYRDAVDLAELQGLTQAEVGQRLGLSLPAAKSRVQRGRALLRELYGNCCQLEFDSLGNVVDIKQVGPCSPSTRDVDPPGED